MSLLEGPGVDRVAVANQLLQAWFVEVLGGPRSPLREGHGVPEHHRVRQLVDGRLRKAPEDYEADGGGVGTFGTVARR